MRALQDAHRDSLDHLSDLNDRTTVKANLFGDHEEVARSAGEIRRETRRIFFLQEKALTRMLEEYAILLAFCILTHSNGTTNKTVRI